LTPNGKLDRKALPAPDEAAYARQAYEAPRGEVETILAGLWAQLLGVERVGRHVSFFVLGGHSLLAVRLVNRVQQAFGLKLALTTLFVAPSLAGLAEAVEEQLARSGSDHLPAIARVDRSGVLPPSYAQERLWFLSQLEGGSGAYHVPLALRLQGELDRAALGRALDEVWARHETLRSVFVTEAGKARVAFMAVERGLPLAEHDLRNDKDAGARLAALSQEEFAAPFDLERGPLVRARLIRVADTEHVLLVTQHHIVSDGWSIGILLREIGSLYAAFARGEESPLAELALQYPDYAVWQRQWLSGERQARQARYWRDALQDAPVVLNLPTDRPRPAQQSFVGSNVPVRLDAELTRGLKHLGLRHGATPFMVVLAAWAVVLSRLSGQEDVVIGTPTANRGRREVEGLIGFYVNTLALRVDVSAEPDVATLLERVRSVALGAQDHQDLPFAQVVEIVQPPRRLEHTPVFQVLLTWQTLEEDRLALPGLAIEPAGVAYDEMAKFDLELDLAEVGGEIAGSLGYATALFDRETIERHVGYLKVVLRDLAAEAQGPVGRTSLLSAPERQLVLDTWNRTEADYPSDRCIHALFEDQARRTPDAIALVQGDVELSYGELNARANRLAHRLIALGVKPDDRVGLCVERSPAMMIGLLGVLKAGGAYVPLDPSYPRERLGLVVGDADPRLVLVDETGRAALGDALSGRKTVALDEVQMADGSHPDRDPDPQVLGLTPRNLAYVIYTSGSTGTPKGVMVEHGGVVNLIQSMAEIAGITAKDRLLAVTTIAFDIAGLELYAPLSRGACVVLAGKEDAGNPTALQRLMASQAVSLMQATPATWRALLDANWPGAADMRVLCGGEALPVELSRRLRSRVRSVWNVYGPTETTIWSSCLEVGSRTESGQPYESIGRPIANTRMYVLDGHGEPVPIGVAGELHIGGAGVARGYLNRPDLTAERFVADRFSREPQARLYRTGDLARYQPDGNIEFLG
ncbi:non-ribosomal peptide synthetase, partial [Mesorhizobium sp. GbtcB19]|uniref:non-ribosomal peptide synthetase n=1 Tax=Mesorhizobium sp. GbtcB19 TaxID=2824764 RepID=UPI001C306FB0